MKNEYLLKDIIQEMIQKFALTDKLHEVKLQEAWYKLVGNVIAKQTTKVTFKEGVLVIYLSSSVLKEEFSFAKSKIIRKLNNAVSEELIKEIQFR